MVESHGMLRRSISARPLERIQTYLKAADAHDRVIAFYDDFDTLFLVATYFLIPSKNEAWKFHLRPHWTWREDSRNGSYCLVDWILCDVPFTRNLRESLHYALLKKHPGLLEAAWFRASKRGDRVHWTRFKESIFDAYHVQDSAG